MNRYSIKISAQLGRTLLLWLGVAISIIVASGCRTVYESNTLNMPMMEKKGDFRGTLDLNNLQLSYAATSNIGIMANGFYKSSSAGDDDSASDIEGSGLFGEFGVGYFIRPEPNIVVEAFAGFGAGNVEVQENDRSATITAIKQLKASVNRFFVQPGVAYTSNYFDIGFAPRISVVGYGTPETNNYSASEIEEYYPELDKTTWIFLEPAITIRAGYQAIKGQFQIGRTFKLSSGNINHREDFANIGISIGLGSMP